MHPITGEPYHEVAPIVQCLVAQLKARLPGGIWRQSVGQARHEYGIDLGLHPHGPRRAGGGSTPTSSRSSKKIHLDRVKTRQVTSLSIA